ncbi:hypothetical protein XFF6990_200042 [Xanthomonas citri pv. fuscans]|nr:hypothetical protein XFF6990_200042 [Xanthomonas citri pv. fuscans]
MFMSERLFVQGSHAGITAVNNAVHPQGAGDEEQYDNYTGRCWCLAGRRRCHCRFHE